MIFITGGTGLLGSHLLFQLTESSVHLRAIYRNEKKLENVRRVFNYYDPIHGESRFKKIEWVNCDILDVVTLFEIMKDCSHVYHCAAIVSFQRKDYFKLMKINRQGTSNIVNCCLELGVKKLCYVSSTAAIGGQGETVISEKSKWKQSSTTSGYSISKYSAEKEVWRGIEEGLDAVIVNPCVIIGAGDWNESSLTIFRSINKGLKFYTNGANAFIDARDVVNVMVHLMNSEIKNERYLCIGENSTFKNLFDHIATTLNKKKVSILVKPWMAGLTWRVTWFFSKITGQETTITKETARSAFNNTSYDGSKIKKVFDIKFRTIDEMVSNAVKGRI